MGIKQSSSFDLQSGLPLDSKIKIDTLVNRDLILPTYRYDGMKVYVEENETNYQLKGGILNANWSEEISVSAEKIIVGLIAGAAVTGHYIVYRGSNGKVQHADSSNQSHADQVIGMALNSAILDGNVNVLMQGEEIDASLAFTPSAPLFLNGIGTLSETAPITGFSLKVGFQIEASKVYLALKEPIFLI